MESEPTKVMVAVNASTTKAHPHPSISSNRAFEWTLKKIVRSNTSDFKILLLHVQVVDEDGNIYDSPDDFKNMRETNKAKGLHLLKFFVKKYHQIGVGCVASIKKGDPKDVICQEVSRIRPYFLVVGSRGLGRFQKVFVGTVNAFCLKHAECPVLTIKRNIDETPSDAAGNIYDSPDDFKNMRETNKAKGLHLLKFFVKKYHQIGVGCVASIKKGDPKDVICQEVSRIRPYFLVVGSRGLGRFQKVFVGTVNAFCLKHAECPVLTIKRNIDETPSDAAGD